MKTLKLKKTLLALALGTVSATSAVAAPVQWTVGSGGNGHWYELFTGPLTWQDANAHAISLGGYLATITSGAENTFVSINIAGGQNRTWLGGSDAGQEGVWRWVGGPEAGQLFTYTNWLGGEPNNCCGGENYLETNFGGAGLWNDDGPPHQNLMSQYVVEFTNVPEPGTLGLMAAGLGMLLASRRRRVQ